MKRKISSGRYGMALTIDDDLFAIAKELAAVQQKNVGVPLLMRRGSTPVTLELVSQLRDELPE